MTLMRQCALVALLVAALPAQAALKVFACEPEWGALARAVGGSAVEVYVATTAQQDPHHVEARPSLVAQVRKADLVACTGAALETAWLPLLLARGANPQLKGERLFFAAEKVPRLGLPQGAVDRSKGDVHAEGNPHVHLDPRRMISIANAFADTLAKIDPVQAAAYRQRADALRAQLQAVIDKAGTRHAGTRYIVFHDGWPYLFDWLGLAQAGTLEPLPGVPPSSAHLAQLAAQMKATPVRGIIHATHDEQKAVTWLARAGNSCALELPYTVGGSARAVDLPSFYDDLLARIDRGCP